MPSPTNRERAMIRLNKMIGELQLTTNDVKYLKDELERIWVRNYSQEQILRYVNNSKAYANAVSSNTV